MSMSDPSNRPFLLIDDEGELTATLVVLEELLTAIQPLEEDKELPAPALVFDDLNAADRILMQLHAVNRTPGSTSMDQHGRFHAVLRRMFWSRIADLDAMGRSVRVFNEAVGSRHPTYILQTIEDIVRRSAVSYVMQLNRAYRRVMLEAVDDGRCSSR
jgi:hypothetical protein